MAYFDRGSDDLCGVFRRGGLRGGDVLYMGIRMVRRLPKPFKNSLRFIPFLPCFPSLCFPFFSFFHLRHFLPLLLLPSLFLLFLDLVPLSSLPSLFLCSSMCFSDVQYESPPEQLFIDSCLENSIQQHKETPACINP